MRHEFRRIGDGGQAVLRETKRVMTALSGLVACHRLVRHPSQPRGVARFRRDGHGSHDHGPIHGLADFA